MGDVRKQQGRSQSFKSKKGGETEMTGQYLKILNNIL